MDTLYLKQEEVAQLVTVSETTDVLDALFRDQAANRAINNPQSVKPEILQSGTFHGILESCPKNQNIFV
jgi:hypothetical protein